MDINKYVLDTSSSQLGFKAKVCELPETQCLVHSSLLGIAWC